MVSCIKWLKWLWNNSVNPLAVPVQEMDHSSTANSFNLKILTDNNDCRAN